MKVVEGLLHEHYIAQNLSHFQLHCKNKKCQYLFSLGMG